jgi:thymidine kinase
MEDFYGYLSIRVGPMRSGKTDYLHSVANRSSDLGEKVIYINSILDDNESRGLPGGDGVNFTSHSDAKSKFSSNVTTTKSHFLGDIDITDYSVICIDEGQFFPDIVDVVRKWFWDLEKRIYIGGLDGSFKQRLMGNLHELQSDSQEYLKMHAICQYCVKERPHKNHMAKLNKAYYTVFVPRLGDSVDNVVKPGMSDQYFSVCAYHKKHSLTI